MLVNEVIYDGIDETEILRACLRTKGAAGVSIQDSKKQRRILGIKIFGTAATDFRSSVALLTRIMCTNCNADPESLLAFWLIPLNNNPGLRPIDIVEVIRRIIENAVTSCFRSDIIYGSGNLQLCAEIRSGCEIAIHGSVDMFKDEENLGILQIDTSNVSNSINIVAVLYDVNIICPESANYVHNYFRWNRNTIY